MPGALARARRGLGLASMQFRCYWSLAHMPAATRCGLIKSSGDCGTVESHALRSAALGVGWRVVVGAVLARAGGARPAAGLAGSAAAAAPASRARRRGAACRGACRAADGRPVRFCTCVATAAGERACGAVRMLRPGQDAARAGGTGPARRRLRPRITGAGGAEGAAQALGGGHPGRGRGGSYSTIPGLMSYQSLDLARSARHVGLLGAGEATRAA